MITYPLTLLNQANLLVILIHNLKNANINIMTEINLIKKSCFDKLKENFPASLQVLQSSV